MVEGLYQRYEKLGGGGGGPFQARYKKWRGGGGRGGCCPLQARYEKRGCALYTSDTIRKARRGGGDCLAEEVEVPYMKGRLDDLLDSARFTIDY